MTKDIYLVIGGSGFLGRHIVQLLLERNDSVSVLDIAQRYDDVPHYSGDISVKEDVLNALEKSGATCVFHAASPHATTGSKEHFYKVNVEGTRTVLQACQQLHIPKLIFTSSSGIVFDGHDINGGDETLPYVPKQMGDYMDTKVIAEQELLAANGKDGVSICILRPATIFGPGDRQTLPHMYRAYLEGKTGVQFGYNKNLTDWTYVTNIADAHLLAADRLTPDHRPPVAGQIFFISNDEPLPFWDFSHGIWNRIDKYHPGFRSGKPPIVIPRPIGLFIAGCFEFFYWLLGKKEKPVFTRFIVTYMCTARWFNITKAKTTLGYKPRVGMQEAMDKFVDWFMAEQKEGKKVQ